jgi:hypothetical protein
MDKYLEGYLSSIPPSEYENIIEFIARYAQTNLKMSEEEFNEVLDTLVRDKLPTTDSSLLDTGERPKDTYNRFFKKASIDILYLFKIIDSLYDAVESYSYLSSSYFSDVKSELDKLQSKIDEFKTKNIYTTNTVVSSEDFKTNKSFEDFNESTHHLFTDRDGSILKPMTIVNNNTDSMITISEKYSKNLVQDINGKTTVKIDVLDYRGLPLEVDKNWEEAVDSSEFTYWDLTVNSKKPINSPMEEYEKGGAYIKFKVQLPNMTSISEVAITPFCSYPVEVVGIIIGKDNIVGEFENQTRSSTDTITFNFKPRKSDELIVVLRQKNYTYGPLTKNTKKKEAEDLWEIAQFREDMDPDQIYKKYMTMKAKEVEEWNERFIREVD